jgi:hypothetical protein
MGASRHATRPSVRIRSMLKHDSPLIPPDDRFSAAGMEGARG